MKPVKSSKAITPRIIISGLSGGSGKTLLSLGLARSFARLGHKVKPFKKGPDYIDAAWLGLAAQNSPTNLDLFFLSPDKLLSLFSHSASEADLSIIEGNRGLFDGRDIEGSCSTAALAETLNCPVLLALNCAKMTRTAAAIILGLMQFEPKVRLAGVVLNNIGRARHESIVRRSIEAYTSVPVLGALPRLAENPVPERHMGLISMALFNRKSNAEAHGGVNRAEACLNLLADFVSANTDLEKILTLASSAPALPQCEPFWPEPEAGHPAAPDQNSARPVIGYVKDEALWFYYAENLEALTRAGARLLEVSLFDDKAWPRIDGLYLGGGFPEDLAGKLSQSPRLAELKAATQSGMPIYAECGGFMILAEELECRGRSYPMAGVFPFKISFHSKPQGLGYIEAEVAAENPFHPKGSILRGHEFHFSARSDNSSLPPVLRLRQGSGAGKGLDGFVNQNAYAGYTHIFAPSNPHWADNFVALAREYCQHKIKRL